MTKPKNWRKKVYSFVEFMTYLNQLIVLVDEEREKADEQGLSEIEIQVYELIDIPYVKLIREHFISLGYTVSFLTLASGSSNRDNGNVLIMKLTW